MCALVFTELPIETIEMFLKNCSASIAFHTVQVRL